MPYITIGVDIMNRSIRNLKKYAIAFLILTLVGVVSRCISLFGFYDSDIGYYKTAALLPKAFHLLSVLSVVFSATVVLFLPKPTGDIYITPKSDSLGVRIASVFPMAGVLSFLVYSFISESAESTSNLGAVATNKAGEIVSVLILVFGVLAAMYFILVCSGKTAKGDGHVLFGYAVILFVLMVLANSYFDFNTTMNSPNKLLSQTTLMSLMLYMLFELRFSLGNASPRGYAALSLSAFYLTTVNSIPGIIAFSAGILFKPEYLMSDLLTLTFSVYVAVRFAMYIKSQKNSGGF